MNIIIIILKYCRFGVNISRKEYTLFVTQEDVIDNWGPSIKTVWN